MAPNTPAAAPIAVLFARADSVYKRLPGCDVWDIDRDARQWPGGAPVVAWTLGISQHWWGHRAEKLTLLYIVGCRPQDLPEIPMVLGEATHVVSKRPPLADGTRLRKGMPGWRPEVSKAEREHPPPAGRVAL